MQGRIATLEDQVAALRTELLETRQQLYQLQSREHRLSRLARAGFGAGIAAQVAGFILLGAQPGEAARRPTLAQRVTALEQAVNGLRADLTAEPRCGRRATPTRSPRPEPIATPG